MESLLLVPQQDIIIKCPLEEIIKSFFKDYEVVWHDPNLNSQENEQYMAQLKKFCPIQCFTEWEKALIYLRETKKLCHVITSGTNGELLTKEIDSKENVSNIYVFCRNKDYHVIWSKNYQKIACVETEIQDILNQIQQKLLEFYKQSSSLTYNLPAFAPIFNLTHKSQMNNLHRFLKVIPNFENREQAKSDFIALSRGIYSDEENKSEIENFEKNYNEYNMGSILKWYTRNGFFFRVTNNSLRIATSDSIQYCRLPLKDLERAIKEQYQLKSKNFNGLLYRGAFLSGEEWSNLKENVGREIEMHGFMSASKAKKIAMKFVGDEVSAKVFITIVVPKGPNDEEQGFADLYEFSEFSMEKEVLFNVRSRFTVLEADDEYSQELQCRHLVLLYGAQGFRKYIAEKTPVQEVLIPENVSCAHCKASGSEKAEKMVFIPLSDLQNGNFYCKGCLSNLPRSFADPLLCVPILNNLDSNIKLKGFSLLKGEVKIPFYGYQCAKCQAEKKESYFVCTDFHKEKNKWCGDCFETPLDCIKVGHTIILERSPFSFWCEHLTEAELNHLKIQKESVFEGDLFQQAQMYFHSHEYEKAIEYYQEFIRQNGGNADSVELADCRNNLGQIYFEQGNYQKARKQFQKSLTIKDKLFPVDHLSKVASYCNLAGLDEKQGEHQKALEGYQKSLEITKSVNGDKHSDAADLYNNIGAVYANLEHNQKAQEFYERSLEIYRLVYGDLDPHVSASYDNLARICIKQGENEKALEYQSKSLEINKSIHGEIHPDVASSYDNLAHIHHNQEEYEEALEYFLKSLDIRNLIHRENNNHPDFADSYNNIGLVFESLGSFEEAHQNYLKCFEIKASIYGQDHLNVADSYYNLGRICALQKQYKKAQEYAEKSLNIFKLFRKENPKKVVEASYSLGLYCEALKENEKALEHYFESLKISQSVYGKDHQMTRDVQFRINKILQQN